MGFVGFGGIWVFWGFGVLFFGVFLMNKLEKLSKYNLTVVGGALQRQAKDWTEGRKENITAN